MKKLFICIMIMIMMVMLASCGDSGNGVKKTKENKIAIYVDKETGVNYLIFREGYKGGMTVRVDRSGKPIVSEVE